MSGAKKYDFSAFDEAISNKEQAPSNTQYDFSDFDDVKKKVDGQSGGQELKTNTNPPTPSQSPSSLQEGGEKQSWQTSALNPAYAAQQAQVAKENAPQPQSIPKQKDWKSIVLDKSSFNKPMPSDATYVAKNVTGEKIEQVAKSRANMQIAIDNTTERALKAKGLAAPKNSPAYIKQRKKIEEAVKNNDAVYTVDPNTKLPALSQTTGFWDSTVDALNRAFNDEEESKEFVNNMTTQQRADYANKKREETYALTKEGYVGKTPSPFFGKAGETIGGAVPFVTKMTEAGIMATAAVMAAPETAGASLVGLAPVLSFAMTTPDMVNQGGRDEVLRRFNMLKEQNPDASDVDLMSEAENGLVTGEIVGGLTNLAFTAIGAKPIAQEAIPVLEKSISNTLKNTAHGTAKSSAELGFISAAGETGKEIEAGIEDKRYRLSAGEVINDAAKSFASGATAGALLHLTTQAVVGGVKLPGQLRSAIKYSLSKENPVELQAILSNNEQLGNVPQGTTEAVMADLNSYNKSLEKTSQDLTPETQASVAGLIQKRDNLMSEMSSKDATQIDPYLQQIDAINNQIKGITETNDPSAYEVNDVTGQPLNGEISEAPLQKGVEGEQVSVGEALPKNGTIEKDEQGEFIPKKYTINRKGENPAPNIPLSAIDSKSFGEEELPEGVKQVKLLEIRGRNSEGKLVGKVLIQKEDGGQYDAEVFFNDTELKEEQAKIPEQKTQTNDKENIPGLPSKVGVGEEPVTTEPIKGAGTEEISTSGVLQAPRIEGEGKGIGEKVGEEVKPIKQLGTGANIYFETNKYRVNDNLKNGKILLNVGDAKSETPLANIEFDNPNEAVFVAKKLEENAPEGLTSDFHNVDKIIENYKEEFKKQQAELPKQKGVGEQKGIIINPKERTEWGGYKVGDVIDSEDLLDNSGGDYSGEKGEKYILVQEKLSNIHDVTRKDIYDIHQGYEKEEDSRIENVKKDFNKTPPIPESDDGLHRIIAAKELGHETILQWKNVKDVKQSELPKQEQKGVGEMAIGADIVNNVKETHDILPISLVDKMRTQGKSRDTFYLENDIEKNGIKRPVELVYHVHDEKIGLSDGHNRLDALKEIGADNIPVVLKISGADAPSTAIEVNSKVDPLKVKKISDLDFTDLGFEGFPKVELPEQKTKENENIQNKEDKRKAEVVKPEPATTKAVDKERLEQSARNVGKREEAKTNLIKLRDEGVLVTADKSVIAKAKKAMGMKVKPVPMTDAEINAQMSMLDAMSNVWKETTGQDDFYDTFISDIKKGDLKAIKDKGGVLFQDESVPTRPISRVTLSVFDAPQFEKMKGQMVVHQSISDFIKGKGKQIEKDIINNVLAFDKYKGQKRISFDDFRNDVEIQVMKLEKIKTDSYAKYGRDNLGGGYGDAKTIIFNAPVDHGETGHFSGDFTTMGMDGKSWELRQIPNTEVWAAVDKDMPDNTPQAEIQKYVGTAGNKGEVEHWIGQRNANSSTGNVNRGLFGHIRAWFDKRNNIFHLAELQSDVYQKSKAADLFAESVPSAEVNEYMNRDVWSKIGDEKAKAIIEERGYKVERVKDEWKVLDKDGRVLAERTVFDTEPGYKEGQADEHTAISYALDNEANQYFDYERIESEDFPEINRQIHKLESLLDKVKTNREFDAINKEIESLNKQLYKYEVFKNYGINRSYKVGEFDTSEEAKGYIDDMLKEKVKVRDFRDQLGDYFNDKVNGLISKKQEFIDKRAKEIKAEKGENMLEKQFIASQKVHEMRLFREAMKHAAEEGADVVRFPSPYTLAVIEGYVDHTGEGNAPYEIIRGDSDRLEQGDTIDYGGTTLMVVDSDSNSITVAPQDEVSVFRVSDYIGEEASNRYSEIEYEAEKHFNDLNNITKEEIENYEPDEWMGDNAKLILEQEALGLEDGETIRWKDISQKLEDDIFNEYNNMDVSDLFHWGGNIYSNGDTVYVTESRRNVESFNQPDGYEAESTEDDFEDNLTRDQQTVVDKYKEMGAMIKKTRPDAIDIRDDNGMEWIETKITDADRNNPIIAFQNEGGKIKGAVDFMNDNKATFHIFDGADISTLAHEITGHLGRRFLEKLAETNEQFSKDYDAVKKWANVKDNQWTTKAEEKFARGFERYLREGKAPTKALEAVFANLKEWLVNIYKNIKGSSIDVKLTQEVKDVFGRLLGGEVKAEKPKMEEKVTPEIPKQKAKLEVEVEKPEIIKEEVKPVEERKTGVKKAITIPLREALGLPAVELPKMGKDIEELQQAKQRIDSEEVDPISMVDDILKKKRGYNDEKEVFDMQYYAHQLDAKDRELSMQMSEADNDIDKAEIANKKQLLSDEIDKQTEAARSAGNKWGKIGYSMQPVIDAGFNISRERNLIKEAYAGEVPQQVKEKIDAITKERDEAIAQKDKIEKDLIDLKAKKEIAQKEKEAQAEQKGKAKKTKEEFVKERKTIVDKIKKKWKDSKGGGTMYSLAVPIPIEKIKQLAAISPEVGELIKSHVEEGISKLDDIVTNIHDLLKDQIDGLTKKDVLDLIGGKYSVSKERSEAAKKVAEIRAEAKKLIKENVNPSKTIQSEIDRLNKKADNIEAKLREGVVTKEKESELNPYNNSEWIKADQRVVNAEKKMRDLKRQAFESQKNWYQKSLMWAGRGIRLAVLSGYKVLGKLTSAATIGSAVKRIPEQAIGSIYNKVFSSIAKKAPIEGSSMALNSELKWYKEFFNPKKFVKNSWDILKTGTTYLNRKMGKSEYEHIPVLYIATDLHQIIKDPVKRATFEHSFDNAMRNAAKEGLDITHPLVIQSIENAAFKRANYEIFQESNALTRKFTAWKNEMEKRGNVGATYKFVADFLIPISSVPTNIARRVGITSPFGLLKANVDVINAYRKGIENLKPEEADVIMRQLKQGTMGTALWMIGWFGFASFGGLYTKFNANKQRDDEDLASDKMEVGGVEIPKPTQHALPLEVIQTAATARRLWNKYNEDEDVSTFEAIAKAGLGSIGAVAEQIPIIETPVHMIMATQEPYEAKKLGEDIKGRVQPQILKETGIISKNDKQKVAFTEKEMESPVLKNLIESDIEIPKIGTRLSYPVKADNIHPKGIMTTDEYNKFSELVMKYSHDYTNENLSDSYTSSSIQRLKELIKNKSEDPKIQIEITELKKQIKSTLQSAHQNAIDQARDELGLYTK